jgi:hypothetical protein
MVKIISQASYALQYLTLTAKGMLEVIYCSIAENSCFFILHCKRVTEITGTAFKIVKILCILCEIQTAILQKKTRIFKHFICIIRLSINFSLYKVKRSNPLSSYQPFRTEGQQQSTCSVHLQNQRHLKSLTVNAKKLRPFKLLALSYYKGIKFWCEKVNDKLPSPEAN